MQLEELLCGSKRYCFLVGSGISSEPPANLPLAGAIVRALLAILDIRSSAREDLAKKYDCGELRFEQFLESLRASYSDDDLRVLDALSMSESPNSLHHFLASAIRSGYGVITTNFDSLIEMAGASQGSVIKTVFDEKTASAAMKEKARALWKLHGTLVDEAGNDHRASIVATLQRIGRKGEAFRADAAFGAYVAEMVQDSALVVMGYSGSDDYDVVPMLAQIRSPLKMLWVFHQDGLSVPRVGGLECLGDHSDRMRGVIAKLTSLGFWREEQITLVVGDTSDIVERAFWPVFGKPQSGILKPPFEIPKHYYQEWKYEFALEKWRNRAFLGSVYSSLGDYTTACEYLLEALVSVRELGELGHQINLHQLIAAEHLRGGYRARVRQQLSQIEAIISHHGIRMPRDAADQFYQYLAMSLVDEDPDGAEAALDKAHPDPGSSGEAACLYARGL
jgi:hypothetical protein